MVFSSILFFIYFGVLRLFSLLSHSVYYCGFLVVKSLICGLVCYCFLGFRWYTLLFCLVYVGGVYILFIFVSVFSPNERYLIKFKIRLFWVSLVMLGLMFIGVALIYGLFCIEFSSFLCTREEGVFYVLVCLTLLFGFLVLSMIMRVKLNYYR